MDKVWFDSVIKRIRKSNFCRIGAATLQHQQSASFKASEAQHTPKCSSMQGLSGHIGLTSGK
jgi:hypothetical protein